jgi:hypothetical protein
MTNFDNWPIKRVARIAGLLSIGSGFPDGFSIYALKKIFVRDDAAATAANILYHETLLRLGIVGELFALAMFAASLVLLYIVFKPASKRVALVFLVLSIMGATVQALDVLGDVAALTFLKSATGAVALTSVEAQAMAYLFMKMHLLVYTVALSFTGFCSLCLAYVATQATFIPRFGGYFLAIDGLGYVTHSFGTLLAPTWIVHIQPIVPYATALLGTGTLMFWLIFKGVNSERWREQNAIASMTGSA